MGNARIGGSAGRGASPGFGAGPSQYQRQYRHRYQSRTPGSGRDQHRRGADTGRSRWGYDRTGETAFAGEVIQGPAQGAGRSLGDTVRVRTRDGEERRLHLGPSWYREAIGLSPQHGDQIHAVGSPDTDQNRNQIMARELNWNGQTYRLRNREGIPLWAAAGRPEWSSYARLGSQSQAQELTGEIEGIETVSPGGRDMGPGMVLRLRSRDQTRQTARIHLGPYWFVEENMPGLRVGQQVQVRGAPEDWGGQQVLLASELSRNQQRVRLRDGHGRPQWAGGWQNWDGWGPGARYGRLYDPARVRTVAGQVESVNADTPMDGMGRGLILRVRTRERQRMRAHLGPVWFAEQFDIALEPGDEATLTGSMVEMNGKRVMMVSQIIANQRQVRVREQDGTPVWAGRGPGDPQRAELAPAE